MGILDFLTRGLFGRRADDAAEDELVPGPMGTEELKPGHPQYGKFAGEHAAEDLRYRNIQGALGEQRERQEREDAEKAEAGEDAEQEPHRDTALEGHAERFSRRVERGHLFQEKTHRTVHKLEKGVEAVESADSPQERSYERWRFRHKTLPKLERRAESYFQRELGELQVKQQKELEHLQKRGVSERELKRAVNRFELEQRRLKEDVDRKLGRPLRGLSKRAGGTGGWRPKF